MVNMNYCPVTSQRKLLKQRRRLGRRFTRKVNHDRCFYKLSFFSNDINLQSRKKLYGLKVLSSVRLSSKLTETLTGLVRKELKRSGRFRLCFFPSTSYTSKPTQVRMGKGKGAIVGWHMLIPAGQVLFELYEPGMNMVRLRYLARILSFRISSRFQAIKLY